MSETIEELNAKIDDIKKKYQPKIDALVARGKEIEDDFDKPGAVGAAVGVDFKVDWKDVVFEFGVPSVTMNDQHISFDLPEVTMVEQKWSFGVPSVCQKDTYPFPWPLDHTVIKVPYPCIQQTTIIFHLPSITMRRTDIVMGIPEFTTVQVRWVIGLPQFTIINVNAQVTAVQGESQQLSDDANAVGAAMKQEITQAVTEYLNPKGTEDAGQRAAVQQQFDSAITRVNAAISEIVAAKGDPTAVPDGKGGQTNLRQEVDDLTASKAAALQQVDNLLQQVHDAHPT